MGCSANELKELESTPAFDKRVTRVKLRELLIKAKIYSDTWNDEQRRKINVQKCAIYLRPTLSPVLHGAMQLSSLRGTDGASDLTASTEKYEAMNVEGKLLVAAQAGGCGLREGEPGACGPGRQAGPRAAHHGAAPRAARR